MGRRQPVARELAIRNAALRYAGRMCGPKDYPGKRPCWQDAADCARACSLAAWLSEPQDDDHWIAAVTVPVRGPCPGHRGTTVAPSGMLSRRCARKEVEPQRCAVAAWARFGGLACVHGHHDFQADLESWTVSHGLKNPRQLAPAAGPGGSGLAAREEESPPANSTGRAWEPLPSRAPGPSHRAALT